MKIRFKATGKAAETYSIENETVNGIDLSIIEHGGKFLGDEETKEAGIRYAERDADGILWVTLQQEVGPGHWTESDWIEAAEYDPAKIYVKKLDKPHAGKPWAKNGKGEKVYV